MSWRESGRKAYKGHLISCGCRVELCTVNRYQGRRIKHLNLNMNFPLMTGNSALVIQRYRGVHWVGITRGGFWSRSQVMRKISDTVWQVLTESRALDFTTGTFQKKSSGFQLICEFRLTVSLVWRIQTDSAAQWYSIRFSNFRWPRCTARTFNFSYTADLGALYGPVVFHTPPASVHCTDL